MYNFVDMCMTVAPYYAFEIALFWSILSAQNKSWKLVGHSIKIGTLLWTIIGFPIGNVK